MTFNKKAKIVYDKEIEESFQKFKKKFGKKEAKSRLAYEQYMIGWSEGASHIPLFLNPLDYHPERIQGWKDGQDAQRKIGYQTKKRMKIISDTIVMKDEQADLATALDLKLSEP